LENAAHRRTLPIAPADRLWQLYLQIVILGQRAVAGARHREAHEIPAQQVYRLKQRTLRWLQEMVVQLEKNSDAAV